MNEGEGDEDSYSHNVIFDTPIFQHLLHFHFRYFYFGVKFRESLHKTDPDRLYSILSNKNLYFVLS